MRILVAILPSLLALACTELDVGDGLRVRPGDEIDLDTIDALPKTELKVLLVDPTAARESLQLTDDLAAPRRISFYDTPDLAMFEAGTILRAREIDDGKDDSTVKVRPLARAAVDPAWLDVKGFKCETDRSPTGSVESCSLSDGRDEGDIAAVAAAALPIEALYSARQEAFQAAHGAGAGTLGELTPLGPIPALTWEVSSDLLAHDLDVESWGLPDAGELLEVSIKVPVDDADLAMADLLQFLADRGLAIAEGGETKTRAALEAYAGGAPAS